MYLGTVSRDDLIKTIGLMGTRRDSRASVAEELKSLERNDPRFTSLYTERDRLVDTIKKNFRTIKAVLPDLHHQYTQVTRKI
jgi:uncharacterized protein YdcH (DUF465 family)